MSKLLDLYNRIGPENYGAAIAELAPYFGTVSPRFVQLRPGYCELVIPHVRDVENHLGTVHAIALCNGAELAAGLMTDVTLGEGLRWIPVGMSVRYHKKARGDQRVVCDGTGIDWSRPQDATVRVSVCDPAGATTMAADIVMNISHLPA